MMLVFFFGMGASAILVSLTGGPWSMAAALALLGAFSSIYHPVGIPMLVQTRDATPALTIGVNGLAGNLGHRGGGARHRLLRQVRRLARGVRRARADRRSPAASLSRGSCPQRERGARPAHREGAVDAAARDAGAGLRWS